jgi:hypothetical protein
MISRNWRLKILNWLGAGYMTIEKDDNFDSIEICDDESRPAVDISGLSFNVMPAQGGTIVQLRKYDDKLNRNSYSTHIIADGQDVAEHIGKIVALELWKI